MTIAANIFRNSTANAIGIGLAAGVQLIGVPVMAYAWGAETYGVWVMLATIPTYLALTDLGFVDAATSDMTMKSARGETQAVVAVLSSTLALFFAAAVAVNLLAAVLICVAAGAGADWVEEHRLPLHLLTLYASLSVISRVNLAGFRANGLYATGTIAYDGLVFVEAMIALAIVLLHGGFETVIMVMIVGRMVNILALHRLRRTRLPWLEFRKDAVSRSELARLLVPAVSGMAIPVSLSIILQGTILLVGWLMSPTAAAVFASVRTISRVAIQLIGIVSRAAMPEIAHSLASGDNLTPGRLAHLNCLLVGIVLIPAGILFATYGDLLVRIWTNGVIRPDRSFMVAMALSMVVHGALYLLSNVLRATNSHGEFARIVVVSAPLTGILVYAGAVLGGLPGVAWALVLGEAFCLAGAVSALRRTPLRLATVFALRQ